MLASLKSPATARHAVLIGIGFMGLGDLIFSLNDAMGKWLSQGHSPAEILTMRSIAASLVMLPFAWRTGWTSLLHPDQIGLQIIRVILALLELICFYSAVRSMPLADVMTFYLASPVFTAIVSPFLLGETVGLKRWAAIIIGLVGVVIAMKPGASAFSPEALWSIAGSFTYAMMVVASRKMRAIPDLTIVFQQTVGILIGGALWLFAEGGQLGNLHDLPNLWLLGIVAMVAHICINRALKYAPAAVVAPVQYTLLLWATIFGYLFFGDVPGVNTLAGAAIIIGAGYLLFDSRDVTDPVG